MAIAELRQYAVDAAAKLGCRLLASGTPPLDRAGPPPISVGERYAVLHRRFGNLINEQGTCGTHVHVAVPNLAAAARACSYIRPWLPALACLTANSPFYEGTDTGYASWRTVLLSRWPTITPPPPMNSDLDYALALESLNAHGVAFNPQTVYWWVRPAPHYSTVEIRIADSQQDVSAVLLYASIAAALVDAALAPGATNVPVTLDTDELRLEIWRAARYGTETILRSPVSGLRVGFWQLFDELIATLAPYFAATADAEAIFGLISAMRGAANGAIRRRVARNGRYLSDIAGEFAIDGRKRTPH
ncbi:hypothetical protein GCM10009682_01860 [Luedemannella flava]|uniref:Glutamate--cysteine ligase 2 n=1 Tax=Luedemannella flava TaxID=349316 RepID=A0ABN2LCE9_9ACTN